jgi:hypothetical protein
VTTILSRSNQCVTLQFQLRVLLYFTDNTDNR